MSSLIEQIQQDLREGKLHLPVLPAIALKVREISKDDDKGVGDLVDLIKADPALSAYLMQVANSSFFARISKSKTLLQAVNRLGMNRTVELALVYSIKTLFTSRRAPARRALQRQWQRSTRVAAISSVLASHCKGVSSDRALLAGLLQDIGSLPIIESLGDEVSQLGDAGVEELFDRFSSELGVLVLESWDFDRGLVEVVRSREDWQRRRGMKLDTADVVMVARLHSYVGTARMKQLPFLDSIPAFHKLRVQGVKTLGPEKSLLILEQAKDEIAELHQSLQ